MLNIRKIIIITTVILILVPFRLIEVSNVIKGVEMCGNRYDCGMSDGVCPEGYTENGKCFVRDPDCGK